MEEGIDSPALHCQQITWPASHHDNHYWKEGTCFSCIYPTKARTILHVGTAMSQGTRVELGPEDVRYVLISKVVCTQLGPEGVPLLEICPKFQGLMPRLHPKGGK